jgi:hypothetical protein
LKVIFAGEDPASFKTTAPLRFLPGFHALKSHVNILFIRQFEAAFIANKLFHSTPGGSVLH